MKRPWQIGAIAFGILLSWTTIAGCGSGSNSQAQTESSGGSTEVEARAQYNETKSMVLDILHTKEGLDTLKDIVRDPQFKQSLAINEADVQTAMIKAMTDGPSHVTLLQQMRNPQFAATLATAYKKDNQTILKELMKDPEYQESMLTLLKSPDFQKTLYDLMKTPQYRKQTMDIMTQSLQNPQFKMMFMDIVKEAIQQGTEERTPNQKQQAGQVQSADQSQSQDQGQGEEKKQGSESKNQKESGSDESGTSGGKK